jgi:LmbE family N-acetylglucosaminyl deacetylase
VSDEPLSRRDLLTGSPGTVALTAVLEPSAKRRSILFVGGHMDDSEWGAGGLMFKAAAAGFRVVVVQTVGDWSNWPPAQGREERVKQGVLRIAREMGIEKRLFEYKYHHVPLDFEIRRRIAGIVAEVQPEIAVIISENDHWTDHANTGRAAKDGIMFAHGYLGRPVTKPRLLLSYSTGANQTFDFRPDTFVDTTDVIDRVAWLMRELDGLLTDDLKPTASLTLHAARAGYPKTIELTGHGEAVLAAAKRWGDMCGARYAEAFQSIQFRAGSLW